jgi:hypothetical protein|mmetsp:Transcript_27941/g.43536  ORF Transcript_27941/g.43536 Transcript_27941/m.43536 type:complete len:183 (+) Transcript_27941:112-660(+)
MWKLIEAMVKTPTESREESLSHSRCSENTDRELSFSEVHAMLDRAINFLLRDVGYTLLDDARPNKGGGVQLWPPLAYIGAVTTEAWPSKIPKSEPTLQASASRSDSVDSDAILKLLRASFDRRGGKLQASELVGEVYSSRAELLKNKDEQLKLFGDLNIDPDREITWEEFEAFLLKNKGTQS